ncbi:MAG: hypothetical protein BZY81_02555 [SAR202 cluster bacterium Io17-Chloro-G4]|nr:MAG: hypothetical protein BZY81_02555 [SAR202 cluster bacterium Io17-Chloro-G4]
MIERTNTSAAQKMGTGLDWLDQLIDGGLPRQSLVVVGGVPGAGKSTLAFHMMAEAVKNDTNAMLVTTTNQPISKLRRQYGNLSFLGPTGAMDKLEFFSLDTGIQDTTMNTLLNTIVGRLQESNVGVVVIDSFRVISDLAPNRAQVWRFLGSLSANVVDSNCVCLLLGEYSLPRDLDLPELAVADVVIYLEVERQTAQDLRTLRIYKTRGTAYTPGRQAYTISSDGISFTGSYQGQPGENTPAAI